MRRLLAAALLIALLFTQACAAGNPEKNMLEDYIFSAASWFHENNHDTQPCSSSQDWIIFCEGRLNRQDLWEDTAGYLDGLQDYVEEAYRTGDRLDAVRATEWHRICLTLAAGGRNPGLQLIADGTYNRGYTVSLDAQGTNGAIWALITMDALDCRVPEDAFDDRESIISMILDHHVPGEGFSLSGDTSDPDITSQALTALAPYYNGKRTDISSSLKTVLDNAVKDSLQYLSSLQSEDGGFSSFGSPCSETCAQVLIALCSLQIDPTTDPRFLKNGNSVLNALLSYRHTDGGFSHTREHESDPMATSQALLALTAYRLFIGDKSALFDLTNISFI